MSGIFKGVKNLFTGGSDKQFNIAPPQTSQVQSLSTPGGTFSTSGPGSALDIGFQRSAPVQNLVNSLGANRLTNTTDLNALQSRLTPGFSDFRTAGINRLQNARTSALSNLRSNLNRRGALGSSFAQSALAQTDLQAGQQQAQFEAQTGLQEIAANQQVIQQRLNSELSSIKQELDQFNRESAQSGQFSSQQLAAAQGNAQLASETAQFNAQIESQQAAGRLNTLGTIAGAGLGFLGAGGGLAGITAAADQLRGNNKKAA